MEAVKDELYDLFKEHKTSHFIETGSYEGHSIARALDIGYNRIYSCEINLDRYNDCLDKFHRNENVLLYYGDSLHALPLMLKDIDQKCTFWLDAHRSGISRDCPTLEELKIIGQHHIKDHTILIDDVSDFGTEAHEGITILDLQMEILKINKHYIFSYIDTCKPNNVMICKV